MSTKQVEIAQAENFRQAQPPQVFVAVGEQIEFVNAGSGGTLLVLTPETAAITALATDAPRSRTWARSTFSVTRWASISALICSVCCMT